MTTSSFFVTAFLLILSGPLGHSASPVPPASSTPAPGGPRATYSQVNVDGPFIAMTFDDGPHAKNTPRLLDLLAEKKIKATFFILGENAARQPEIVKRIAADGHEIANHTWTHLNFAKSADDAIRSEMQRAEKKLVELTGVKPRLMRPPYGAISLRQRQWMRDEFGYKIILWDVDPLDWKEPGVSVVAQRIIAGARAGSIILTHDIHAPTIDAMPEVLDALLAKGFKFVTVSELIEMDKGGARPELPKPPAPKDAAKTPAAPADSPAPGQ